MLALDINVTKAGVALPTGRLLTLAAPSINPRRDGRAEIGRRIHWWRTTLTKIFSTYQPDIVAIEDYALHGQGLVGKLRGAEVGGVPRELAHLHGARLIDDIKPNELKRWATGAGNADKAAMVSAAVTRGAHPNNDDEADAALLRLFVLETLDSPTALRRWLTS